MYELLVVVHIFSGMAWVVAGVIFFMAIRGIRHAEGGEVAIGTMSRLDKSTRALSVTPFLVLATGITMVIVSDAWTFSQLWVYLAITLAVLALGLGAYGDGFWKKMERAHEEGGDAPDHFEPALRLLAIEIAIFVIIVSLMVYKPI